MYTFSEIVKKDTKYNFKDGIYYVSEEPFTTEINLFLSNYYSNTQNNQQNLNYNLLPFVEEKKLNSEWKFRQKSLKVVDSIVKEKVIKSVLEIGPWNGWLTHRLSDEVDNYVVVDIFDDVENGLGAFKHYKNQNWTRIHADVEKLDFFATKFDLIIYNHCLQFFSNWQKSIAESLKMLADGGTIIVLGCSFFSNPSIKVAQLEKLKSEYVKKTNHSLFFRPNKGYFDKNDEKYFTDIGFRCYNYSIFYRNRLLSYFDSTRPRIKYAIYEAS